MVEEESTLEKTGKRQENTGIILLNPI